MEGREIPKRFCTHWGLPLIERLQDNINSGQDSQPLPLQVMLDKAKAIARLNKFFDQLQMTLLMQQLIIHEVCGFSEKSIFEQASILAARLSWISLVSMSA